MIALIRCLLRRGYNEDACIRILFDRTLPLSERDAAAESLSTGQTPTAEAALFRFVLDDTEDEILRETAASALGSIYDVVGVTPEKLAQIPQPFRDEVLSNISTK